jgi:hypothetical protein
MKKYWEEKFWQGEYYIHTNEGKLFVENVHLLLEAIIKIEKNKQNVFLYHKNTEFEPLQIYCKKILKGEKL